MKPNKYFKKYVKIQAKAQECTSREDAQKLLAKAAKLEKKNEGLSPR